MTTELFIPIKFRTTIILTPSEITKDFESTILTKLKLNYENICSKYGYIKKDTIKIIKRSVGQLKKEHFNANMYFDIICIAEICNPAQGSIIKCKVKAKNLLGVLAEGYYDNIPILQIIIPKISAGIQSEINIDTIAIDDEIKIEVCGKKYQLFDKHISIIGRAIKSKPEFIKNAIINENADDEDNETTNNEDEIEEIYNESEKDEEEEDDDIEDIKKPKKGGVDDDSASSVSVSDIGDEMIDDIDDEIDDMEGGGDIDGDDD
jgi:DNA-directed RNA polymerase subunit E'/Rpb7